MRSTPTIFFRPGRWAALLGVLGLVLAFGWPAFAAPLVQTEGDGEQQGAQQGRRGTPVAAAATPIAGSPVAGATPVVVGATPVAGVEAPDLTGVFSVGIGEADLPPGLAGAPALVGLWNLALAEDGTYTVARQDVGAVAGGTYTAVGETLTFVDWSGLIACGGEDGERGATYAWRLTEDVLSLTPISDECGDRKLILTTRTLGSFEACATAAMALPAAPPPVPGQGPVGEPAPPLPGGVPVGTPAASPVAVVPVAQGEPAPPEVVTAIEALLRQATGCWSTGDPARFLPLHSQAALDQFVTFPQLVTDVAGFMATPVSFELIGGEVRLLSPDRGWAYVELTIGPDAFPQRLDFVREGGTWLFDYIFLLPPQPGTQPAP